MHREMPGLMAASSCAHACGWLVPAKPAGPRGKQVTCAVRTAPDLSKD